MECARTTENSNLCVTSKSLPLSGQTLFLCLQRKQLNEVHLQQRIEFLGGKLEKFFVKEVTCVLTDEVSLTNCKKLTANSRKCSKSLVVPKYEQKIVSPSLVDSGFCSQKSKVFRRSSIKEKAVIWGKKLWRIDKFMVWLKAQEHKQKSKQMSATNVYFRKHVKAPRAKLPVRLSTSQEVIRLQNPFIKMENACHQYRPYYRVLVSEPALHFQKYYPRSPFDDCKEQISFVKRMKNTENNKSPLPTITGNFKPSKCRPVVKASRPQRQYCECCNIYFQNLDQHLQGPKHVQFVKDSTNFSCVVKVVEELDDIESFEDDHCRDTNPMHSEPLALNGNNSHTIPNTPVAIDGTSNCEVPLLEESNNLIDFLPSLEKSDNADPVPNLSHILKYPSSLLLDDPFLSCFDGSILKRCSDAPNTVPMDFSGLHINLGSPEVFGNADTMFSDNSSEDSRDLNLQSFLNSIVKDHETNENQLPPIPLTNAQSASDNKLLMPASISRANEPPCRFADMNLWPRGFLERDNSPLKQTHPLPGPENLYTKYDWAVKYRTDTKIVILRTQKAISVK